MHLNLANLLAAMAILAVLSVSLIPFATVTGAETAVEQGAMQLAQELQAVRQLAVTQNLTYYVTFERVSRSYLIKGASIFIPARRVYLPPGVEWFYDFQQITYYGSGRVNLGQTITLHHRETPLRVSVIISTMTGRVRVERGR